MTFAWQFPGGTLKLKAEEDLNDSDKTITVPTLERWIILWIHVEFATTVTAGNRTLTLILTDAADDVIYECVCAAHAANTEIHYEFLPGFSYQDLGIKTYPLPMQSILDGGYKIRIYDSAVRDPAADDLIIQLLYLEMGL